MTSMYVVMNKTKWNSISKEDQQAIEKINEEWIEKQGKLWIKLDKEAKAVRHRRRGKMREGVQRGRSEDGR